MNMLVVITVSLIISFFLGEVVVRFRYPRMMGQVLAGTILTLPFFGYFRNAEAMNQIQFLADIGIIFLFLMIGLQTNMTRLREVSKNAAVVSVFCIAIPFALGCAVTVLLGYPILAGLVVGACLSLTAEATSVKLLLDMKLFNTRAGQILFGAGLIDDIFGIIFLAVIIAITKNVSGSIGAVKEMLTLFFQFCLFGLIVWGLIKLIPRFLHHIQEERSRVATFSSILIIGLLIAVIAEKFHLGPILGAFLAGLIIQSQNDHVCNDKCLESCLKAEYLEREKVSIEELRVFTYSFVIPFFFINIGIQLDVTKIFEFKEMSAIILIVAILGKLIGAQVAKAFTDINAEEARIIGWGMNARGAIGLVIAQVAFVEGMIPTEIYAAVVTMAIVTTVIFPIAMKLSGYKVQ